MKNNIYQGSIAGFCLLLIACNSTTATVKADSAATANENTTSAPSTADEYFTFEVDGKKMSIKAEDISTSYSTFDSTFKIFAGADKSMSVLLTVPKLPNCPCTVPAGSAEAGNQLDQGSVSLQNYPEKNYSFNSWYNSMHDTPPAEAIKITGLGTVKDGYRYISGIFHAKVLKTESNGDKPDNKDYEITNGKFSVKHDTHGATDF